MSNNAPYFKVKKGKYNELNLTNAPMDEDTLYVCKEGKLFYDYSNDSSTGRIQIGENIDNTNTKISTTSVQPISVGEKQINCDSISCGVGSIYATLPINSLKVYVNNYGPSSNPFFNLDNTRFIELKGQFKEELPNTYPSEFVPGTESQYHSTLPEEWINLKNQLLSLRTNYIPITTMGYFNSTQDIPSEMEMTGNEGDYYRPSFDDFSYDELKPQNLASIGKMGAGGIITFNNLNTSQKFLIFALEYKTLDVLSYHDVPRPGGYGPGTMASYSYTEFNFTFYVLPISPIGGYGGCSALIDMLKETNSFLQVTTQSNFNPRQNKYYEIISTGNQYTPTKDTTKHDDKTYYSCKFNTEIAKSDVNANNLITYEINTTENNIINFTISTCITDSYNLNAGRNCNLGNRSATIGMGLNNFNSDNLTLGRYNRYNANYVFTIGNGAGSQPRNCFGIDYSGRVYTSYPISTSGADYAEYFEWETIPPIEDCRGLFVTLNKNKIKLATKNDKYILGAISAKPTMLGNSMEEEWKGTYQTDIFGDYLYDDIENTLILSKNYDKNKKYIPRSKRKEWAIVGLIGQIVIVDDGTCEEGGFCYPGENGIATATNEGYYVMERLDDNHIKVLFK